MAQILHVKKQRQLMYSFKKTWLAFPPKVEISSFNFQLDILSSIQPKGRSLSVHNHFQCTKRVVLYKFLKMVYHLLEGAKGWQGRE